MARQKKGETPNIPWTSEDFNWCIENDFQVYPVVRGTKLRIAIRRGGISTNGKDRHINEAGIELRSKETVGKKEFKNTPDGYRALADFLPNLYRQLRETYGS